MTDITIPPMPTEAPTAHVPTQRDDWWDRLYDPLDAELAPTRTPAPADRLPDWRTGQTVNLDDPDDESDDDELADEDVDPDDDEPDDDEVVEVIEETDDGTRVRRTVSIRRYLADHRDQEHRLRVLAYNGSAALTGWGLGIVPRLHGLIAECAHDTGSPGAALVVGVAMTIAIGLLIDRRTRGWWGPLAWTCRIPLASAVLALGLYTS